MLKVIKRELVPEFHDEATPNFVGNIAGKIVTTLEASFEDSYIATPQFPLQFGSSNVNDPQYLRTLSTPIIAFEDVKLGDDMQILDPGEANDGLTFKVAEKTNDQKIITDTNLTVSPPVSSTAILVNLTPMKGLKLAYGLPENNENFTLNSKLTGGRQEFVFDGYDTLSTTEQTMTKVGDKSWQRIDETCTVKRLETGIGFGNQVFRFVHTFFIGPIYKANQLNNFGTNFPPIDFENDRCLRHDFRIYMGRDLSNDSALRFNREDRLLGDTGWLNKNFNQGPKTYNIVSTEYKRLPSNEVIGGIELTTDEQLVTTVIETEPGTPFIDLSSQFYIHHTYMPKDEGEYKNNNKTQDENFYIDRVFQTVGANAIPGDRFGTDLQIFKEVSAVRDNATQITITNKIQLTQAIVDDLTQRVQKRFALIYGLADVAKTTQTSNWANVYHSALYVFDPQDDGMFQFETKILNHYEVDPTTEGSVTPTGRIEDDLLGYTSFAKNLLGRVDDEIDIKNAVIEITADKNDGSFFYLKSFNKSFSGLDVIDGDQFIDFTQSVPLKFPTDFYRKLIKITRTPDSDTGLLRTYEAYFPFVMDDAYWLPLDGVSDDFFNVNEPNNGLNRLWDRFAKDVNYTINYRFRLLSTKNGEPQEHIQEIPITSFTYNEGAKWDNKEVKLLDSNGQQVIDGSMQEYILLYEEMTLQSTFEWIGGGSITGDDVVIVFILQLFEDGDVFDKLWFSSEWDLSEFSPFESIDQSGKIVKTNPSGNNYRGEATLRTSDIPVADDYKIAVRYYSKISGTPLNAKTTSPDDTPKTKTDSVIKTTAP